MNKSLQFDSLLVPLDLSPTSEVVLERALELVAKAPDATTNFAIEDDPDKKRHTFGDQGLRVESLRDRIGDRVASRLLGGALSVSIRSGDYRKQRAESFQGV